MLKYVYIERFQMRGCFVTVTVQILVKFVSLVSIYIVSIYLYILLAKLSIKEANESAQGY